MLLVTAEKMRVIENRAAQEYGLSGEILMENAARAAVDILLSRRGPGLSRTAVFCGKGNNGGDGWAMARLLREKGWEVAVYHPGLDIGLSEEAETNRRHALEMGIPDGNWEDGLAALEQSDIIIDALLGTGVQGYLRGELPRIIQGINNSDRPVLSVDVPSGISGNTGQVCGEAVRATWTVTFGLMKLGLAVYPGRSYAGELFVEPIGIPKVLLHEDKTYAVIESANVARSLPARQVETHKGNNGHLLIVGGAEGMTGAPVLSAIAGLRTGAGLVTLARRQGLEIWEKPMEVMSVTWPAINWSQYNTVVFGPGVSMAADGRAMLERVLEQTAIPRVIDADGLNLLAAVGTNHLIRKQLGSLVLTPHPGEMARLCGVSVHDVQANRIRFALENAVKWGVVIVLKGAATLIATPQRRLWVNPNGNPGLATAGTGDVLAGIIGSLLAQGLSTEAAAVVGVYLHGAAGDDAAREIGEVGLIAGDLLPRLPKVIRSVKQGVSI